MNCGHLCVWWETVGILLSNIRVSLAHLLLWPRYSLAVGTGWPVFQRIYAFWFLTVFSQLLLPPTSGCCAPGCTKSMFCSLFLSAFFCFKSHCSISSLLRIFRLVFLWKNLIGSVHILGLDKTTGLWLVQGLAVKQQGPWIRYFYGKSRGVIGIIIDMSITC